MGWVASAVYTQRVITTLRVYPPLGDRGRRHIANGGGSLVGARHGNSNWGETHSNLGLEWGLAFDMCDILGDQFGQFGVFLVNFHGFGSNSPRLF